LFDATTGGVWSSGTGFAVVGSASGVVTGTGGGAAVISYTGPNGCATTKTIHVASLTSLTGNHPLCAWGDTMTVSSMDTTGTYSSVSVSVLNLGHGMALVTARIPGLAASVTYTIPAGCSLTVPVTVNPLPLPISGTLDLCLGSTTTLSDPSAGGVWSAATTTVAAIGATSGVVTTASAGSTAIVYTLPTGCRTDTVLQVQVLPVAGTISGGTNICTGGGSVTLTMTGGTTGGVWSSAAPSIATVGTTGTVIGVSVGASTISYAQTNVCGTVAAEATVNVYPAVHAGVITGADTICAGNSTTLLETVTGGVWTSTNSGIATVGSAGEVLGVLTGADTIMYTVSNPGCSAVAMHSIRVLPYAYCGLGASPPTPLRGRGEVLRIWPNPNDGTFSVLVTSVADENVELSISDVTGRAVKAVTIESNKAAIVSMNVAAGVYFVSARTSLGVFSGRVDISVR